MSKHWRRLTANEVELARRVFSDGIDYARVKIYRGIPYLPDINVAIAPNGNVYFPRQNCPADFALAGHSYQMWLIHELTHVWQHQLGFKTWWAGILLMAVGGYVRRKAYVYPPPHGIEHFSDLNMEQQADLLAHYYAARYLPHNPHSHHLPAFQTALHAFLDNPLQRQLLPRYRNFSII
ncbi:type IV secretion protein Rhs [Neisseria weixii]|uniref:type IV secretion protein Rhs n=1 Tax=Neisseria weixii TaxID=1853276 RepID=UPI00359FC3A9